MAVFEDLPSECFVMILSCLRLHHIETLAKTLNRRLMKLCLPLLRDRIRAARNDRIMKEFFGNPGLESHEEDMFEILLESRSRFSIPEYVAKHLEYLQMDGELKWLAPLDEYATAQRTPHWGGEFGAVEIEKLRYATQQLGVYHAVPEVFWTLMRDKELQARVSSYHGNYFILGSLSRILANDLVEVYKTEEDRCISHELSEDAERKIREIRAYALGFYTDQPDTGHWYLYIDSEGHHCVLLSESIIHFDWNGERRGVARDNVLSDIERNLGVEPAISENVWDACLLATDFETWLACTYFMQRARCMCAQVDDYEQENDRDWVPGKDDDCAVPVNVAEFLQNVFTEEGRKRQVLL